MGDRIFYYPHPKATVPENLVVAKIDLLMTKYVLCSACLPYTVYSAHAPGRAQIAKSRLLRFRRWDEQVFYVPNYVLAKNTIINIQRSDNQWHEFFIQVAANTPSSSIWKVCKPFCLPASTRTTFGGLMTLLTPPS